jgi:MinD-like ATPase involved in chromosome partitioning or flagellar assembly
VLIACWSPKGGSGTTVLAVALSLALAADSPDSVLLADLAGDVPAVLGLPDPEGLGLADWLTAEHDVPDDALDRLEIDAGPDLRLLPAGRVVNDAGQARRGRALAAALARDPRPVVVDCGRASDGASLEVAAAADASLLVLRPCYLAVRRAMSSPVRPSAVVLVAERERSLGSRDIEEVLQTPVPAVVPVEPSIARAVDAGLLARRMPRPLSGAVSVLIQSLPAPPSNDGSSTARADGAPRRRSPLRGAWRR